MRDPATPRRALTEPLRGARREIGPIGTVSRVAGGSIAIAAPSILGGVGGWEVAAALTVFPLLATGAAWLVVGGRRGRPPDAVARRTAVCSAPACLLIAILVAFAVGLDALTPVNGDAAFLVWLGASMILAAARGYGGCEVLAFPNALTGRRDRVGCILYTPIDRAEARHRTRRRRAAAA